MTSAITDGSSPTDLDTARRGDLVLVAGGIGLAPLRPALPHAPRHRASYRRIAVVVGARTSDDLLSMDELDAIAVTTDTEMVVTVDSADAGRRGRVGLVTEPLAELSLDPRLTTAMLCGPEPMMRFSAKVLLDRGVPGERIQLSLERNMKCGIGVCGHCQLGRD